MLIRNLESQIFHHVRAWKYWATIFTVLIYVLSLGGKACHVATVLCVCVCVSVQKWLLLNQVADFSRNFI